jgi:hypothetical protein
LFRRVSARHATISLQAHIMTEDAGDSEAAGLILPGLLGAWPRRAVLFGCVFYRAGYQQAVIYGITGW